MNFLHEFSVGTVFQNISFYTFLSVIACLNIELLLHGSKRSTVNSPVQEIDAN
ncbi:MAG: hypothetical protein ACTHJ8_03845 [Mucilaginibacter sp.]